MPVTINTQEPVDNEEQAERRGLVNELYELHQWFEGSGAKEKIARMDQIKKALTADVNSRFPDRNMTRVIEGDFGKVEVGAGSCKREVTDPKYIQGVVGDEAFYAGITVPLSFVDQFLSPDEKAKCVSETPGAGSRKVTISAR